MLHTMLADNSIIKKGGDYVEWNAGPTGTHMEPMKIFRMKLGQKKLSLGADCREYDWMGSGISWRVCFQF